MDTKYQKGGDFSIVTDEIREKVQKVFPFAYKAPNYMINVLMESNRLYSVDHIIREQNSGKRFFHEYH